MATAALPSSTNVDPHVDWFGLSSGATSSARAVSRGLASRGGRRPLQSRMGSASVSSDNAKMAHSSFAQQRRVSLAEFATTVATIIQDSQEVSPAAADDVDTNGQSGRKTPAEVEATIDALITRVSQDAVEKVQWQWRTRQSVTSFAASIQAMLSRVPRLGFELPLRDFRAAVDALAARVANGEIPELQARADAMNMATELGPEIEPQIRRAIDMSRDMRDFAEKLKTVQRPMDGTAAPQQHETAVAALLANECRLGYLPYLETLQPEITSKVRHILVDWMVDVSGRYRFTEETLHLSVALVDRFLGVQPITRRDVQLIGVSSIFLAAKYEEIYPPDVLDLVGMTANTYSKEEILHGERLIFMKLQFRVTISTSNTFAQAILAEQDPAPTPVQRHMVGYLMDALLHTEPYGAHRASEIAQAAVYISRVWCAIPTPTPSPELIPIIRLVYQSVTRVMRMSNRCPALRNKYSVSRYERVSQQPLPVSALEDAVGEPLEDCPSVSPTSADPQTSSQGMYQCGPGQYHHHYDSQATNGSQYLGSYSGHAQPYAAPSFY